jgi:hypothetical protein
METYGTVNPDEASAALATARQSRARVAWAVLIIAGAAGSKFAPWPPIAAAVLVFLLFAGTGLTLSARAARR